MDNDLQPIWECSTFSPLVHLLTLRMVFGKRSMSNTEEDDDMSTLPQLLKCRHLDMFKFMSFGANRPGNEGMQKLIFNSFPSMDKLKFGKISILTYISTYADGQVDINSLVMRMSLTYSVTIRKLI